MSNSATVTSTDASSSATRPSSGDPKAATAASGTSNATSTAAQTSHRLTRRLRTSSWRTRTPRSASISTTIVVRRQRSAGDRERPPGGGARILAGGLERLLHDPAGGPRRRSARASTQRSCGQRPNIRSASSTQRGRGRRTTSRCARTMTAAVAPNAPTATPAMTSSSRRESASASHRTVRSHPPAQPRTPRAGGAAPAARSVIVGHGAGDTRWGRARSGYDARREPQGRRAATPPRSCPSARASRRCAKPQPHCRGCHLYARATQTVFSERPEARPDHDGRRDPGRPRGSRRQGLRRARGPRARQGPRSGRNRPADVYITNVVKHFKFEERGKRRIHQKPGKREVDACMPWLRAELDVVKPTALLLLGATAAKALLGESFRLTHVAVAGPSTPSWPSSWWPPSTRRPSCAPATASRARPSAGPSPRT